MWRRCSATGSPPAGSIRATHIRTPPPYDYYQRSKDLRRTDASRFMHPETAALLDRWLLLLKERGEEAAFAAIRAELTDSAY